jgi:hypothetical protein
VTGVFGPLNSKKFELGPNLSRGRKFGLTLTQNSFSLSRVLSDFRNNNKKVLPDRYSATTPGEACVAAPLPRFFGDVPHQRPLEHSRKHLPCHPRRAPKKPNPTGAINPEEERTPRSGADAQPQRVSGWPRGKQVRRRHEVDSPLSRTCPFRCGACPRPWCSSSDARSPPPRSSPLRYALCHLPRSSFD